MSTRDELRDELLSVIAAAPELAPDDRAHLADVFLNRLEGEYRLVPRTQAGEDTARTARSPLPGVFPVLWLVIPVIVGAIVLFSLVSTSMFVLFHPPILLFVLLIVLVFRSHSRRPRRRMYR